MSNIEDWKKHKEDSEQDTQEGFCGACAAIPLAFAGVGASAYGASSRDSYKKAKKIALWAGIISIIISISIAIYYLKTCSNCR